MKEMQLGSVEARFADSVWACAPINSSEIVKLAEKEFGWKKSTTYTVLKRLCEKGLFENKSGKVHALVSREEFYSIRSEKFVEESFNGSLPAFLAAFTNRKKLSEEEIKYLRKLISEHNGNNG